MVVDMRWPFSRRSRGTRLLSSVATDHEDWKRDRGEHDPFGGVNGDRDVTPAQRARLVRMSRVAYKKTGVYGQVVDTLVNFVLGDGVVVTARDRGVQEYLKKVLDDPANEWHAAMRRRVIDLLVDGELPLSLTVPHRPGVKTDLGMPVLTHRVLIGTMEAGDVASVKCSRVNKDRILSVSFAHGGKTDEYPIARPHVTMRDNGDGTSTAVVFWRVNVLGTRGNPYLSRSVDTAKLLDDAVGEMARRWEYLSRFWMHATYETTGDAKKDEALEKKLVAWMVSNEPGEALATTGGVKVNAVTPDLKLPDQQAGYETILDYILGSHGVPRMWYSSGGDTNRATSVEQGTPIHRSIDALQATVKGGIEQVVSFIVWVGQESGQIATTADTSFSVAMADVATRDSLRDVQEISALTMALDPLVENGTITAVERQRILRAVVKGKQYGEHLEDAEPMLPGAAPDPRATLPLHRRLQPIGGLTQTNGQ